MMSMKHVVWLLCLLGLFACKKTDLLIIEGNIGSTEKDMNGQKVYLLTITYPQVILDSALIADNCFQMKVPIDTVKILMLRPVPLLTYFLQPLLVVGESGKVKVVLGQPSLGKGTPLNDVLQTWKEHKSESDYAFALLQNEYRKTNDELTKSQQEETRKQLIEQNAEYNFRFIKENKNNVVGQFVYTQMKSILTPERIEELGLE